MQNGRSPIQGPHKWRLEKNVRITGPHLPEARVLQLLPDSIAHYGLPPAMELEITNHSWYLAEFFGSITGYAH